MNKKSDFNDFKRMLGMTTPAVGKDTLLKGTASDLVKGMSKKPIQYSSTPMTTTLNSMPQQPKMSPLPKPKLDWFSREGVSAALDPIRKITGSPLGAAGALGLAGVGLGYGLWRNAVETGGSLGRYPIRKLTGMTDEEYDQAMEELASDSRYKWLIPGTLAAILGGGYLALKANPNQEHYGLTSWTPKTASVNSGSDELFRYGGYVPDIDFSQVVNARQAKDMFSNDPNLKDDPYVRNMGISIINNASKKAGFVNPTLGDIYDSTASKVNFKLSWQGVTGIAANTMIANATAHLFTAGLGAVLPLSQDAKRTIIDAGTWAAFASSIFN